MPPKQKPVSELGGIQQSGNSFRARVKLGSTRIDGPNRSSKREAEADLANARGAASRDAFAEYLASLRRQPQDTATLPPEGGHASASAPATEPALDREPACRGGDAEPASQKAPSVTPADAGAATSTLAAATEHSEAPDDYQGLLLRLSALSGHANLSARIVDHACGSTSCVSHRIADICFAMGWRTNAELCDDQPMDACGYIAADAVVRLRDAALSQANSWVHSSLPDYSALQTVVRGEEILHKRGGERVLTSDEVNVLVRHYAHLAANPQAHEEWWGGAVALDHFLDGALDHFVRALSGAEQQLQHQWRVWIVNTQTSTQRGSHWFTVAVGKQLEPDAAVASQSARVASPPRAESGGGDGVVLSATPAAFQRLFPEAAPVVRDALRLAGAEAADPQAVSWLRACEAWDAAIADGSYKQQKKRRKLCSEHGFTCPRVLDKDTQGGATLEHARRQLEEKASAAVLAVRALFP